MRDTVLTDRDIARLSAKENLSTIDKREGYAEAMAEPKLGWTGTIAFGIGALVFAGLTYASWENIDATWLRWIVGLLFGALAMFSALAALGTSPSVEKKLRWPAAVLDKHADKPDAWHLTLMTADGKEHRLAASEDVYNALRVGDVGVAVVGNDDDHDIASFKRL
jgi:hypothetical protein